MDEIEKNFQSDAITDGERYNQVVDVWIHAREEVTKNLLEALQDAQEGRRPELPQPGVADE